MSKREGTFLVQLFALSSKIGQNWTKKRASWTKGYYSYEKEDGTYTEPAEYVTKSTNNYSFIFVGDPQIGSSNELKGSDTAEFYQAQSLDGFFRKKILQKSRS